MKTTSEIRHLRLLEAIKRMGTIAALAEAADLSPAYLSQAKNKLPDSKTKKPKGIGNAAARKIEAALGEQSGWMDHLDGAPGAEFPYEGTARPLTAREQVIMDLIMGLTPEQQEEILPELRAAFDANRATQKLLKQKMKTVGNRRIENEFGLPGQKIKGKQ